MSGKKQFVELLRRRKAEQENLPEEVAKRKREWLLDLAALMCSIDGWLSALKKKRLLDYEASTSTVSEENLGDYEVPTLKIVAPGGKTVSITPAGTYVVHALGRVDVVSGPHRETIARFGPGDWHVVKPDPEGKSWMSRPLDEDEFFRLLTDILE